jgi:hypothetical protein
MIFLSYSWKDQAVAHEIDVMLRSRCCDVWIDFRELDPESDITQQLDAAIRDCSLFLAVRPVHRESSPWMAAESLMARRHHKPIFEVEVGRNELSAIEHARTLFDVVAKIARMSFAWPHDRSLVRGEHEHNLPVTQHDL